MSRKDECQYQAPTLPDLGAHPSPLLWPTTLKRLELCEFHFERNAVAQFPPVMEKVLLRYCRKQKMEIAEHLQRGHEAVDA